MKYLKTYETINEIQAVLSDYVKIPYYCDEFEEYDKFYQIKRMDYKEYYLVSVFDDKDPGWISNLHVRNLLPEEEEELKIKLDAKNIIYKKN